MISPSHNFNSAETFIIGLAGKKRSGKDTVAGFIGKHLKKYDTQNRSIICLYLADSLKDEYCKRVGITRQELENRKEIHRTELQDLALDRKIKEGEDYWVRQLIKKIKSIPKEPAYIIIPDVRYLCDAEFISKVGGIVWRINRDNNNVLPDNHLSETQLDRYEKFDEIIDNNVCLNVLRVKVNILVDHYFHMFYDKRYEQIKHSLQAGVDFHEYRW